MIRWKRQLQMSQAAAQTAGTFIQRKNYSRLTTHLRRVRQRQPWNCRMQHHLYLLDQSSHPTSSERKAALMMIHNANTACTRELAIGTDKRPQKSKLAHLSC